MEGLLVLLALVALSLPVLIIVALVWSSRLSKELRGLRDAHGALASELAALKRSAAEARVARLPGGAGPEPAKRAAPPAAAEPGPWTASASPGTGVQATPSGSGAEATPPASSPPPSEPATPPRAVVFTAERLDALTAWLRQNWIYVVSAASLALAGLFLVEYGIEIGVLTPAVRVLAGLLLGAAFVAGGEYLRRRWGDRPEDVTAYLPSVFSGAGVVVLFGSVLAALHLYALVPPGAAFAGLVAVAALAVGLGWYSGPLLAALGLLGAFGAPFLVGGSSPRPALFYGYFGLVAVTGLAIDAGRRWAWVSVLALAVGFPAATQLYLGIGRPEIYAGLVVVLTLAAISIPPLKVWPVHAGAAIWETLRKARPRGWPGFPTRLAAGALVAAVAGLLLVAVEDVQGLWIAAAGFAALFLAVTVWAAKAEALEDLAVLPAAGLVALPLVEAFDYGGRYAAFVQALSGEEGTPIPQDAYWLVAFAAGFTLAAAWRSWHGARWPVAWAAGAALVTPAMIAALDLAWAPARGFGAYGWALAALGAAGLMTALALAFAPRDKADKTRVAGFTLAALGLIAFSLSLVLTETALTLAFAAVTLAAALLDRKFDLRPLTVAVQIGAIGLAWRLIFDPGLGWAEDAPYWELALGYGGSVAALVATVGALRPRARPAAIVVAESAAWTLGAVFVNVLIARAIQDAVPGIGVQNHWAMSLMGLVWLVSAANQLWRTQIGGRLAKVRWGLAGLYAAGAAVYLAVAVATENPALSSDPETRVLGPAFVNTLAVAYLLPALVLGLVARRFGFLDRRLRLALALVAAALGALWLFLAIRDFWRGAEIAAPDFSQPELYSYTMALLLIGAALLWQAIAKRSATLRKIGMGVIALTIAKVFLVDMSGLVGLLRVFSFLALGLALAGLAFLNRWAASHTGAAAGKGAGE